MAKINLSSLDRIPPQSPEAEVAVLGCLMLDKDAIVKVADQILPEDFYELKHQIIFQAMLELFEKNVSIHHHKPPGGNRFGDTFGSGNKKLPKRRTAECPNRYEKISVLEWIFSG